MGRRGSLVILLLLAGLVAACSGDPKPDPGCPRIAVVTELSRATYFRPGDGRDLTDVVAEAELELRDLKCTSGRNQIDLDFHVLLAAVPGPANAAKLVDLDYFVAVRDPQGLITAKETFRVRVPFGESRARKVMDEQITPRIPVADKAAGAGFEVLIGFQLSKEQIEWNQQRRSRR